MNQNFEINQEQLFSIEILVNRLNLSSEKFEIIRSKSLALQVNFLDLPKFFINFGILSNDEKSNGFDIFAGKSCIFVKKSADLVKRLEVEPVCLEIHRVVEGFCEVDDENPICWTSLLISGCFCTINNNLSEPYIIKNSFNLIDRDKKHSGIIDIFLRLSPLGKFLQNKFQINDKSMNFSLINSSSEFICSKVIENEEKIKEKLWTPREKKLIDEDISPRNILGVSMLCRDIDDKNPVSKIKINPENNQNNIPTIEKKPEINIYCQKNLSCNRKIFCSGLCPSLSILKSSNNPEIILRKLKCQNDIYSRLRGGSDNISFLQTNNYQKSCTCRDKSSHEFSYLGELKKPCQGIDCLTKALKDAEDFVESFGKLPGMAALGLMDPTDSPYFSKSRQNFTRKIPQKRIITNKPIDYLPKKINIPLELNKKSKIIDEIIEKKNDIILEDKKSLLNSPCGEKICKSKKIKNSSNLNEKHQDDVKKIKSLKKINKLNDKKYKMRKISDKLIKSQVDIKVSKKIVNLVRSVSPSGCFGHKSCVEIKSRVPSNMGWLWNTKNTPGNIKPKLNWKPGAISRSVWKIFESTRADKSFEEFDIRPVVSIIKGKKNKSSKSKSLLSLVRNQRNKKIDEFSINPTLHIHRKKGDYYFTMYPIKSNNLEENNNKDEEIKPIQFKLTKNHDNDDDSDSSLEDIEIEFSPPGASDKLKKLIERKNIDTQVTQQEIIDTIKNGIIQPLLKKKLKIGK